MSFSTKTALTCIDSYKLGHADQYPPNTTRVYSNFTARSVNHLNVGHKYKTEYIVWAGIQNFLKELKELWDETFFLRKKEEVVAEFAELVAPFVGPRGFDVSRIEWLHDLGYLPLQIKALPEGAVVPVGVPVLTITNTLPEAYWLPNFLETHLSADLWKIPTSATISAYYRRIIEEYAELTGGSKEFITWQGHDFSVRGMSGIEDAARSGFGHLLSFSGTDNIPAVVLANKRYQGKSCFVGGSVPACYDDQTEVLTESGFKLFCALNKTEKVAQYHPDGTVDFVMPKEYFADKYTGNMVHFSKDGYRYFDTMVTPNHRMVRKNKKDGRVQFFEAGSEVNYSSRFGQISAGIGIGSKTTLSSIERLKIAFQADGSFSSRSESYNGERTGTIPIRFSLKKERKAERLRKICEEGGFAITESKHQDGYYSFRIALSEQLLKDFSWVNLSEVSHTWAVEFIEELTHWDGCSKKNTKHYTSTNKSCVDIAQAVGALAGYKTQFATYLDKRGDRKEIYSVTFTTNKNSVTGEDVTKTIVPYDGTVYCVSVPTKMLIVRRNGVVSVCGNTEHSVMCAGSKEGELETFRRLLKTYPSGVVSIVSDTWDFWRVITEYAKELKEEILSRTPDQFGLAKVVFRPDSGDPAKILCGYKVANVMSVYDTYGITEAENQGCEVVYAQDDEAYYKFESYDDGWSNAYELEEISEHEVKGAVQLLWEEFGGTINAQGYKTLNPHVGLIYGDSITPTRCDQILRELMEKGFASDNVVFGIGSYTFQYTTRDTLGFAMKATYVEESGKGQSIFKDPVTDSGTKKSARGLLCVVEGEDGYPKLLQDVTPEEERTGLLRTVFEKGELLVDESIDLIRARLAQNPLPYKFPAGS